MCVGNTEDKKEKNMKSGDNLLLGAPSLEMAGYTHKTQDGEQGEFQLHL